MKKLIPMLLVMFVSIISTAQTEISTQKNATSTNEISLLSSQSRLNYSNPISEMEIAKDNSMQQFLCLNFSSNLKQQRHRSFQSANFGRGGSENPYKARNIGIGFLIGGAVNAGAGAYLIYDSEQNPSNGWIDLGPAIGLGAVFVGGASIIGGTIATIIGSVHGHKYASSHLRFQSNGKSFGLAYNF